MVLDRALADAEVCGDILAGVTGEDQFHDLPLPGSEPRDVASRFLPPRDQLARISRLFERARDAGQQFITADGLLDEIQSARLHRLNRHRHVAIAGDHDGGQPIAGIVKPLQQFEPVHPRQIGVDQQASFAARNDTLRGRPRKSQRS